MLERVSRESITFRFQKDEELIVPRSLVEKSPHLQKLLQNSHDNTLANDRIADIAHETLDDVFRLLNKENPIHTDAESMKKLVKALNYLELNDLEKKMQMILTRIFSDSL